MMCYLSSKDGCGWTFYLQNPIPGSVWYLIKDNALNDLFGKTRGILSIYSVTKKRLYLIGKCVFDLLAVVFVEFCHSSKYVLVHIRIKGEVGAVKLA